MSQSGRVGFASGFLHSSLIPNVLQFHMCANPPLKHAKRPEFRGTLHSVKSVSLWLLDGYQSDSMQSVLREAFSEGVDSACVSTPPVIPVFWGRCG